MENIKKVYYCLGDTVQIKTRIGKVLECVKEELTTDLEVAATFNTYRLATINDLEEDVVGGGIIEGLLEVEEGIVQWQDDKYALVK